MPKRDAKTPALEPCPFCGGPAYMAWVHPESFARGTLENYWVRCVGEHCPTNPQTTRCYRTKREAAEAWNRRACKEGGSRASA